MEDKYNVSEILLAVNEIKNRRKEKKIEILKKDPIQKYYSTVPKETLKLIEKDEKIKS